MGEVIKDVILGIIIGDVVGSRFEILNIHNKEFELFNKNCRFTDDSVMTLAVAKAFLDSRTDYSNLEENVIKNMTEFEKNMANIIKKKKTKNINFICKIKEKCVIISLSGVVIRLNYILIISSIIL